LGSDPFKSKNVLSKNSERSWVKKGKSGGRNMRADFDDP